MHVWQMPIISTHSAKNAAASSIYVIHVNLTTTINYINHFFVRSISIKYRYSYRQTRTRCSTCDIKQFILVDFAVAGWFEIRNVRMQVVVSMLQSNIYRMTDARVAGRS